MDAGAGLHDPLDAAIQVVPTSLDFLTFPHGESLERPVTIRSIGGGELHLEYLGIDGPSAFTMAGEDPAHSLAPGDETTVFVTFEPQAEAEFTGSLQIVSNDLQNPQVSVELLGGGRAPQIYLNPASWDFGDVTAGCVHLSYIHVANLGSMPLTLGEITFSASSDEMHIDHDILEGTELAPGANRLVTLTYEPRDEMPDAGYLTVASDDPARPEAMAVHHGTARLAATVVDEFTQALTLDTDILFVVDNSGSMSNDQNSLATNFSAFLDIMQSIEVDYQLGVVTTDDSRLQGAVPIMTPNTPDVAAAFADAVTVGTMGSGTEMGFAYGLGAVTPPLTEPGQYNDGFLRDNASLHVIFVSDEEEQSAGTVTDWVTAFQDVKSHPDLLLLSSIVEQNYGQRYEQAVTMTGGLVEYLSNPNWINTLSQLAWLSFEAGLVFPLSQPAVPGTIGVEVNEVPVYEGWYVDDIYNAVIFWPDYVPDDGDLISVTYHPGGDC